MGSLLKQSTSVDVGVGPFLDETDGKTAETLLTITQPDIRLKKNGGAWAQKAAAQTLTHEEAGWYELTLDGTDTDTLGILIVAIHESGALPVWKEYMIVAANVYDSLIGGGDVLDVSTTQFNGSAVTQASGRPEVNMTHIAGSAVSTSIAQLGVNIVNFGGSAGTFASGRPEVNLSHIAGAAVSTSTAQLGVNVVNAAGTAWNSGSIGAATLAADTITDAKVASDVTIASVTGSVGSVSGAVGSVTGSVGSIAAGGITTASFAAGAIDAAAIAPDAIGASEFAQAAADKVWSSATRTLTALGTGIITAASFSAGAIDAAAIATDAIGAAELAADAVTEIGTAARNSRVQGTTGRQ